jgi:hypothetical protein
MSDDPLDESRTLADRSAASGATARDVQAIGEIVQPLLGSAAWNAGIGHGSFLTIEFGAAQEAGRRRDGKAFVHGEWHLWVYLSAWRVETATAVLGASEDSRDRMMAAATALNGRPLVAVELSHPSLDTSFCFEGDHLLRVFPIYTSPDEADAEHWMLFTPGHMVLNVGPASRWSYRRSDLPD